MHPASPTATPMRASNSCTKFDAAPHKATMALHKATVSEMIVTRLPRSAQRAIGKGGARVHMLDEGALAGTTNERAGLTSTLFEQRARNCRQVSPVNFRCYSRA